MLVQAIFSMFVIAGRVLYLHARAFKKMAKLFNIGFMFRDFLQTLYSSAIMKGTKHNHLRDSGFWAKDTIRQAQPYEPNLLIL